MNLENVHVSKLEKLTQEERESRERFIREMTQMLNAIKVPYSLKNISPSIDKQTGQYYYFTPLKYGKNTTTTKD